MVEHSGSCPNHHTDLGGRTRRGKRQGGGEGSSVSMASCHFPLEALTIFLLLSAICSSDSISTSLLTEVFSSRSSINSGSCKRGRGAFIIAWLQTRRGALERERKCGKGRFAPKLWPRSWVRRIILYLRESVHLLNRSERIYVSIVDNSSRMS